MAVRIVMETILMARRSPRNTANRNGLYTAFALTFKVGCEYMETILIARGHGNEKGLK